MTNLQRRLLDWYDRNARDLPWRGGGCTPYRVLVSEAMLQQTQVATVIPYFQRFMHALPTLEALAEADEQAVLRLWQGLGYYSRARNLHRAAKAIVQEHGGAVPRSVEALLALPGIGRYTAGAIASIAYDIRAPILDGNVTRVLCRLRLIEDDPRSSAVQKRLWELSAKILPNRRCGDFNSALMELGAMICTPRSPDCPACPLRRDCLARAAGRQEEIPPPRTRAASPLVQRDVYRIANARGQWLIEQRPAAGRWAGMWQFITRPAGQAPPVAIAKVTELGLIRHTLTHRRYIFRVLACTSRARQPAPARWVSAESLEDYPMPRPHVRIREM